jgi:hypothetical protein
MPPTHVAIVGESGRVRAGIRQDLRGFFTAALPSGMDMKMLPAAVAGLVLGAFFMIALAVTESFSWLFGKPQT